MLLKEMSRTSHSKKTPHTLATEVSRINSQGTVDIIPLKQDFFLWYSIISE